MEAPGILPNPGDDRDRRRPVEVVPFEDARRLVEKALAIEKPSAALVVGLLAVCGLKNSEISQANIQDLIITQHEAVLRLPCRGSTHRLPLPPALGGLAKQVVAGRSHGPLFLNGAGNRMTDANIGRIVNRVAKHADVEKTTPGLLRNTAGALAAIEGASSAALMEMLGLSAMSVAPYLSHAQSHQHGARLVWRWYQHGRSRSDLLDQAEQLLSDPTVTAAAPVVLVGAALEEHLREACTRYGSQLTGSGSIEKYKGALIRDGHLSVREWGPVLDTWRDMRNAAAHGQSTADLADAKNMAREVRRFIAEGPLSPA